LSPIEDVRRFDLHGFTRPVAALATYYLIISLAALPLFPVFWLFRMFKYWTLEYEFDDEGISMKWGVLWRREILLTYPRIQDIHLTRGIVQRWMGLANLSIQTAGGSAAPEMVIEGAPDPEGLRDALYLRMRGVTTSSQEAPGRSGSDSDQVLSLLTEIRDLLRDRTS
jgi:putative membrane protein